MRDCAIDCGFVAMNVRAALRVRSIICVFFTAEGRTTLCARSVVALFLQMAELLRLCDGSWVCCRGWPRFGCAILDDCMWIRGLHVRS